MVIDCLVFLLASGWVVCSFYGWLWWRNRGRKGKDQGRLRGSEREFVVPFSQRTRTTEDFSSEDQS